MLPSEFSNTISAQKTTIKKMRKSFAMQPFRHTIAARDIDRLTGGRANRFGVTKRSASVMPSRVKTTGQGLLAVCSQINTNKLRGWFSANARAIWT